MGCLAGHEETTAPTSSKYSNSSGHQVSSACPCPHCRVHSPPTSAKLAEGSGGQAQGWQIPSVTLVPEEEQSICWAVLP